MSRFHLLLLLATLAALAFVASLVLGSAPIALPRLVAALGGRGDAVAATILFQLRLPRAILGLAVGAMLGLSGASLQGYLRNPLADPAVLGLSGAAALGAVVAIYFGIALAWPVATPAFAILGALGALALLFGLARGGEGPVALILSGVAVSTLAGAGISLALNLAPNPFAAIEIATWLMGSLENRSAAHLVIALPCIAAGAALLLWDARALDALTLGEDGAAALGVDLRRVRLRLLAGTAIGVGGAVAVSGAIGFVGLIVPHLVRPFTDRLPSATLVPSALGGAALLTFADVAVRLVPTTSELRLGVVTALIGVPFFLAQIARGSSRW